MLFHVLVMSFFGFSLFRSCLLKGDAALNGIGALAVFGSLKRMSSNVCLLDRRTDTLRQFLFLNALFEVHCAASMGVSIQDVKGPHPGVGAT